MAKRRIFDLKKDGTDWALIERGGNRAKRRFDTKAEGVKESPKLVQGNDPSQLVIRKENGQIQSERTYPRGSDPKHRKG